jgi:hypothetical protein
MKKITIAALGAALLGSFGSAHAELPVTGTLLDAVIAEYGEPTDKTLPIGQPSITRWMYESFTVVFENDHVVHSFARVNSVENRELGNIPERPAFVSLIDQTRNKPDAKLETIDLIQNNVSAHEEKMQIHEANNAANTIKSLEMATPQ